MEDSKKYYWLKLKRDFFKRHDIRIVEEMPNGKDYILFYLKMLVESVDHDGQLRFSDTIPYDENMLATITNTNLDIVRSAMQVFTSLHMIEIVDDGTIYMTEVLQMIGSASNTDNAIRQQRFRDRKKQEKLPQVTASVTNRNASVTASVTNDNESKSIEIEKEKELELELDNSIVDKPQKKTTRFIPPTLEEVEAYCDERGNDVDPQKFFNYYTANGWRVGKNPMKDWRAAVRTWEKNTYGKPVNKPEGNSNPFTALKKREGWQ